MENIIQNETAAPVQGAAVTEETGNMGSGCGQFDGTAPPLAEPAATSPSDTVVVLMTTRGEKATKTFFRVGDEPPPDKTYLVNDGDGGSIRVGVRSYGNHFLYTSHARPVTDIHSLSALLDKLAAVDNAFVVRGEPIPDTNPLGSRNPRRSQPRPATGDKPAAPATYRAVARRWIALDMDKVPGKADPATDPEGAARYLIGLLPDEFHGVTCHVQWTSSQGMAQPGTLSARLWYWLEEPAEDRVLREWAKAKNAAIVLRLGVAEARALLDPSLFNPVQPHYTAAPVFLDGIPDPLPRRGFLLAGGADAVRIDFGGATLPTKGLAEAIRTFGEDGLWGSLRTLAIAYARETADEAERTPEKLVALLQEVMERYNGPRADELPGYIADGAKLASLAEWALDNVEHIPREVADLNKRHFVSRESGKTRVYNEEWDDSCKRHMLTRSSFDDFSNFHNNRLIRITKDDEVTWVRLGRYWLSHPQRRQYDRIAFNPAGVEDGAYNLWRGWAVEPEEGDWSLLRTHIRENACGGDEALFGYLMDWFAHLFQNPAEPGHVAVVFKGNKGTGKGKIAEWVRQACGQHGLQISNSRHLVGNFNAHLRDCVFLFADEAFWAGDKQADSVLKALITEPLIPIEAKGVDVTMARNMLHIMMASNADWVVPASTDERRYAVFQMGDAHKQDLAYFAAIDSQMKAGGLAAMLHELLNREYDPRAVRTAPVTEALRDQQQLSMAPAEKWWFEKLWEADLCAGTVLGSWVDGSQDIRRDVLHVDFRDKMRGQSSSVERTDETALGIYLKKYVPNLGTCQRTVEDGGVKLRKRFWVIPPLAECRAHFDAVSGRPWDWPDPAACEDVPVLDPYENGFPGE